VLRGKTAIPLLKEGILINPLLFYVAGADQKQKKTETDKHREADQG